MTVTIKYRYEKSPAMNCNSTRTYTLATTAIVVSRFSINFNSFLKLIKLYKEIRK